MFNPEIDLEIVEVMTAELKPYLLSKLLYWPLNGSSTQGSFPRGTLSGLVVRLHQLESVADSLTPEQVERLTAARQETDTQFDHWRVQVEEKAAREIKSRFDLWEAYLIECEKDPERYQDEYPTQVFNRTALAFLPDLAGRAAARESVTSRLILLDQRLQQFSTTGPFVWHEALAPAYPAERFWWLYISLATG